MKKLKFLRNLNLLKRLLYDMKDTIKKAKKSVPMSCVNKKKSAMKPSVDIDEITLTSSLTELKHPQSAEFMEKGTDDAEFYHIYAPCPLDQYMKTREAKICSSSFAIEDVDLPVTQLPLDELKKPRAAKASNGSFGIDVEPPADQPPFDELTKTREAKRCRMRILPLVPVLALLISACGLVPVLYCKLSFHSIFLELL